MFCQRARHEQTQSVPERRWEPKKIYFYFEFKIHFDDDELFFFSFFAVARRLYAQFVVSNM